MARGMKWSYCSKNPYWVVRTDEDSYACGKWERSWFNDDYLFDRTKRLTPIERISRFFKDIIGL